jgi:hypothetical protein
MQDAILQALLTSGFPGVIIAGLGIYIWKLSTMHKDERNLWADQVREQNTALVATLKEVSEKIGQLLHK